MQLLLTPFPLLVNGVLFFVRQFAAQLLHTLLVLLDDGLALATHLTRVLVLQSTNLFFVSLDDALDLRLQTLDCLGAYLVDLLLLPFFFAHFLGRNPGIFVLFQLDPETIIDDFLLAL